MRIENWLVMDFGLGGKRVVGHVYDDTKGRFEDGELIHTSEIQCINEDETEVNTLYSTYKLGRKKNETI